MKYFLLYLTASVPLFGSFVDDEIKAMEYLIEATEEKVSAQKELLRLMQELKKEEAVFFKGEQKRQTASKMVATARQILHLIQSLNLQQMFSSVYIEELAWLSSLGNKKTPSRP